MAQETNIREEGEKGRHEASLAKICEQVRINRGVKRTDKSCLLKYSVSQRTPSFSFSSPLSSQSWSSARIVEE